VSDECAEELADSTKPAISGEYRRPTGLLLPARICAKIMMQTFFAISKIIFWQFTEREKHKKLDN
jgi:hypothetical protein